MSCRSVRNRTLHLAWHVARAIVLSVSLLPAASIALDLDFLRDTPLMYLTETDKVLQRDAALYVLEHAKPNVVREWQNSITGFSGRIEGGGDWIAPNGQRCRKIKLVALAKGAESVFVLPLCKDESGEWFIGSGLELHPLQDDRHAAVAVF